MLSSSRHVRPTVYVLILAALAISAPACGGGGGEGGPGPDGAGQGLVLMNFQQAGQDNVPINRILRFTFSEPVDEATIGAHSIQIREGPSYGRTADGQFVIDPVNPSIVHFEPKLLSVCGDASTAGLSPGSNYKVTIVGAPEEFAITNTKGQRLGATLAYEFTTRSEEDPEYLEDQIPGQAPYILERTPSGGDVAVLVDPSRGEEALSEITLVFSENIDPCSITQQSVSVAVYENGGAHPGTEYPAPGSGVYSGFEPAEDSVPSDPTTWGGNAVPLLKPQSVICDQILDQDYDETKLRLVPQGGVLPENSLVVVSLTFTVTDFGGSPLSPEQFSFTTENTPEQSGYLHIPFDDTTPVDENESTADVNTTRSPDRAQGWMLFAGDGDNGEQGERLPAFPVFRTTDNKYDYCDKTENKGEKTIFDPPADITLHTGADRVTDCFNSADRSTAVEWEFRSFRIADGITVTLIGLNPAILKVQGDVVIENGGTLLLRGGEGEDGHTFSYYDTPADREGGVGIAGAGDGGIGRKPVSSTSTADWSDPGYAGYGSPDAFVKGGHGAGDGGVGAELPTTYFYTHGVSGVGGGGGGHAMDGADGMRTGPGTTYKWANTDLRGTGGGIYGAGQEGDPKEAQLMRTPSAGSGGGGGGWACMYNSNAYNLTYYYYAGEGGGGGAGGGFVDLTAQGDIQIYGRIDARGGTGGRGGIGGYTGGAGGGGGSGGGVRLITPGDINLQNGTITTAGGTRGTGSRGQYPATGYANHGGNGGSGRIVLEDGDSVITAFNTASLVPTDGQVGFSRGVFDPTRFGSGASNSMCQTGFMLIGPIVAPDFDTLTASDIVAGIPLGMEMGATGTSMAIDARGRKMLPDGSVDNSAAALTPWVSVGYFTKGDTPTEPKWYGDGYPTDLAGTEWDTGDRVPGGIQYLNGMCGYLQIRIWFFLPSEGIGPTDPGPYVEDVKIPYRVDM